MSSACSIPTPHEDIQGDGRWLSMHRRFVLETKVNEPDVLFIGDSILANLVPNDLWEELFVPLHALNFSIGGDQIQHVLWRLQNGELELIKPKVIVVHAGTNNHGYSDQEICDGIVEITNTLVDKQPQATIVVLGLLPRGQTPNPLRERNMNVNKLLKKCCKNLTNTQLVIIDPGFVSNDGTISHHDLYDYLHLTRNAYRKAFEPLRELIKQLIAEIEGYEEAALNE